MTQVLTESDSFGAGSTLPPSPPTSLKHYIRLVPWNVDPAHASGGTGYSYDAAHFASNGTVYSGWSSNPGGKGPRAAVSTGNINQTTPHPIAIMPRAIELEDCEVSCGGMVNSTDATYINANGATFQFGVGARLSGGTVTGSTVDNIRLGGGAGYWFVLIHDTASGGKFQLLRVVGSTVTRLVENPVGAAAFMSYLSLAPSVARTMRMTVATESGNVRIRCYTSSASLADEAGGDTLIFDYLDNSGSKITGAGRCGLLLGSEYQRTGFPSIRRVAPVSQFFQIKSGPTVVHRDEWSRAFVSYGLLRAPGQAGGTEAEYSGWSLMSGWSGDYQYMNTPTMVHDTTGNRISLVSGGSLQEHWWFSQRVADDPRKQDRVVTGRFDSTGSANAAERHFGIFLRATPRAGTFSRPMSCYWATLSRNDVTDLVTVNLWRRTSVGLTITDTLLATNSALSLALDTNIVLGFGVQTLGPDLVNGYAQLNVSVNASQVVLVAPPSPVPGVIIDASGTVVDATSNRVLSGSCQGIKVLIQPTNPRPMYVDTWATGAGAGPVDIPENDQESIAVLPEYTTIVGTLTLPVESSVVMVPNDTNIRHELDADHVYTSTAIDFERRSWEVTVAAWTLAERDVMLALQDAADGVDGAFYWTPPGYLEAQTVVHFVDPIFDVDTIVPGQAYACRFKLEELRGT